MLIVREVVGRSILDGTAARYTDVSK